MSEVFQGGSEMQSLTLEESSAISSFERDETSIFSRRVQTGSYALHKVVPAIGKHLTWESQANSKHAYLAIFPKHEKSAMIERRRKFGTPFPGLYSLNGEPTGINKYIGGVNIEQQKNPVTMLGSSKSIIVTHCAFNITKDVRFTMCNIGVKSVKNEPQHFNYRVFLLFLVTFGDVFHPLDISSILENQVIVFFRDVANEKIAA